MCHIRVTAACALGPRSIRILFMDSGGREREFFIDNLLVRIHFVIVMIRWTSLAPWEFEFPVTKLLKPGPDSYLCRIRSTAESCERGTPVPMFTPEGACIPSELPRLQSTNWREAGPSWTRSSCPLSHPENTITSFRMYRGSYHVLQNVQDYLAHEKPHPP